MEIFGRKKVNDKIDTLASKVENFFDITNTTIERLSQIKAADVAMDVLGAELNSGADTNKFDNTTYNLIQKLQLPSAMSWDYWVAINQWVDYWVNRYEIDGIDDGNEKEKIYTALRVGILYGQSCYVKDLGAGSITASTNKGKYNFYPSKVALDEKFYILNGGKSWGVDNKLESKEIDIKDASVFVWRFNGVGDFVWCMKQILTDIYMKKILECNVSHLTNKIMWNVKNANTFKTEFAINSDPFRNIGVIIKDGQENGSVLGNSVEQNVGVDKSPNVMSLIEALKHHQEYYYNMFGHPITSSKQQSLSADANLSISSCDNIASEHDRRVTNFIKLINKINGYNINLIIKDNAPQEPKNENADKEGEGYHNSDGENNKVGATQHENN